MARLPVPGSDGGDWGDILNEFLLVSHNTDGTEKNGAPLVLPVNLGPDRFTIDTNGGVVISPHDGSSLPLIVTSGDDTSDTVQIHNHSSNIIAAITPGGAAIIPSRSDGVGLYIQGSSLNPGSGLLMDLENGRSVVTVDVNGGMFIQPAHDDINLTLQADSGQTSHLQEWSDSGGTPQAWIDADGNPGGKLGSGGGGMFQGNEDASWSASPFSATAGFLVSADSSGGNLEIDLPEDPSEGTVVGVQMPVSANGNIIAVDTTDGSLINGLAGYTMPSAAFSTALFVYAEGISDGWVVFASAQTNAIGQYVGVEGSSNTIISGNELQISFDDGITTQNGSDCLNWDPGDPVFVKVLQPGVYGITVTVDWRDSGAIGPIHINLFTECGFIINDQRPAIGDGTTGSFQALSTTLYLQPGDDISVSLGQATGSDLTPDATLLVTRIS